MGDRSLKDFLARARSVPSQSFKIADSLGCLTPSTWGCRAYSVVLMAQGFCRQLPRIYTIVQDGLRAEAASVRVPFLNGLIEILKNNSMLLTRMRNIEFLLMRLIHWSFRYSTRGCFDMHAECLDRYSFTVQTMNLRHAVPWFWFIDKVTETLS